MKLAIGYLLFLNGTALDIGPFMNEGSDNNVILIKTENLTMTSRPKQPKYDRNKNVLVIGVSGSGKMEFWLISRSIIIPMWSQIQSQLFSMDAIYRGAIFI